MYQLDPSSAEYKTLLSLLRQYIQAGQSAISSRTSKWNEAEKNRKAYINLKEVDKKRLEDANSGKAGYPGVAPIVVPITFAMNMTTLSYLMSIFTARMPVIPIIGGGDDSEAARKMESILQYQCSMMKYMLKLYIWFQDVLDYGVGVSFNYWKTEHTKYIADANQMGIMGMINKLTGNQLPPRKIILEGISYEGNDCDIIDPFNLIVDPRYPLSDYERGDFFGYSYTASIMDIKHKGTKGELVNTEKVQKSNVQANSSKRDEVMGASKTTNVGGKGVTQVHRLFVKIIPSEFGLSEDNSPALCEFRVTSNNVIIYGDMISNIHGKKPVSILEFNPDGHSLFNLGQSELLSGLQNHLSWLFNSHMDNVRKSLNDMLIVDPSRINMKDLTDPEPGKVLRLSASAMGQDVRSIVHQLQVQDVTSGHLNKASVVIDFMQRISAATDNMMGMPNFGRRTATEIQNISVMAGGRMKTFAELCHVMGIKPQHYQFIANTQQYLSQAKAYQIVGENGDFSKVAQVSPGEILGEFHIPPADGTLPPDRLALAQTWKELFNMIIASPAAPVLTQVFNPVAIFENITNLMGAKDIKRFLNVAPQMQPPQVMPNEQIDSEVQAGNMVPLSSMLGGGMNPNSLVEDQVEDQFRGAML